MAKYLEYNFDGLVGPTHGYAGLSQGNLASTSHAGEEGNPRAAALEGLRKMRFVASLGAPQAVLPPHPRPAIAELRKLGFSGSAGEVLAAARAQAPELLARLSSASAMWTANAATVVPSSDTHDGRLHLAVANLSAMPHRSIEAAETLRVLNRIFDDAKHFRVHPPLPHYLGDEGAANHLRLAAGGNVQHLFGWGQSLARKVDRPRRFVARQWLEASQAVARQCLVLEHTMVFWQQHPDGIDGGAFHSDVLAVGNDQVLLLHELSFVRHTELLSTLKRALDDDFVACVASERELPLADAVRSYPFNSQLVTTREGKMAIIAPREAERCEAARSYLARAVAEVKTIEQVHYIDVNASMNNGGGPACLRLRVRLDDAQRASISARVFLDDSLYADLEAWVKRNYRDRLRAEDLGDPALLDESQRALDELTQIMQLGNVFDFQSTSSASTDGRHGGAQSQ